MTGGRDAPDAPRAADAAAVGLLAVLAWAVSVRNGFVFDDHTTLLANRAVTGPFSFSAAFTHDWFGAADPRAGGIIGLLRPLPTLSFAAEYHLGGGRPALLHASNVLAHAVASVLFYRVFAVRLGHRAAALFAGALFAVHALHAENVASIVGRADVFAFIALTGLWSVHRAPARWALAAGPALLAAALLSKESSVLIGALLFLRDVRDGELTRERFVARYLPLAAVLGAVAAWRVHVFGGLGSIVLSARANPLLGASFVERKLTALSLFGRFVTLLVAPVNLLPDYGRGVTVPLAAPDGQCLLGAAALAGLGLAAVRWWRTGGARHDAVLWLTLPGLFVVGMFVLNPSPIAERLLYLPSAGGILIAGEGLRWLARRGGEARARALAALVIALSLPLAALRARDWRSDETLFADAVATEPGGLLALVNLGKVRFEQRRYAESFALFRRASAVEPRYAVPRSYLGALFALLGRDAEAEAEFRRMDLGAREEPVLWANYPIFLASRGRHREALARLAYLRARGLWTPLAARVERQSLAALAAGRGGPAAPRP